MVDVELFLNEPACNRTLAYYDITDQSILHNLLEEKKKSYFESTHGYAIDERGFPAIFGFDKLRRMLDFWYNDCFKDDVAFKLSWPDENWRDI